MNTRSQLPFVVGKTEPVWWEKTVEYAFVRRVMPDNADACPMAGKPETWLGDLIEKNEGKFRLIEFKRNVNTISRENEKYGKDCSSYLEACKGIPDKEKAAHWLVFGEYDEQQEKLKLKYRHYHSDQSGTSDKELVASTDMSMMGFDDFVEYIDALAELRGESKTGSLGGLVMAAVGDGHTTVLELSEFVRFVPRLAKKFAPEPPPPASRHRPKG